jgi:hypothetical protein
MPQKKHKPEEIVAKQVDVLLSQGRPAAEAIRTNSVTPFTYYRWRKEFGGLKPGDLVATGTPTGVGACRMPAVFMRSGDLVEIEAERIGKRTPIVAA